MRIPLLDIRTRKAWRAWLRRNHATVSEVWVVFHKRHTGLPTLPYDDAVEEALCYGWIDSLVKRLDDGRYARKFTPRRADSRWSTANRRRYAALAAGGQLAEAGVRRAPTDRSGDAPRVSISRLPQDVAEVLRSSARVREAFDRLAPSHKRAYLGWIATAKRDETRLRRVNELVRMLSSGKPGPR